MLLSLGMVEMALVPAIYRKYSTTTRPDYEGVAPGITSRFDLFTGETFSKMKGRTRWI
ncbi:hypothetical protein BDU57DRAFT_516793 [Ampelomyces quisqualis]|uniref:Uncharacterized protein n=1 Tax=Ampelomyces quisqualis TaxID=50730 RepID=A0A6A5QLV4_AMPQU|nr:hypothetical protein BDU57DRAFT_516793 [Ampelomyces quisqualis]